MSIANNPQSFMNGYLSAMRNSIITMSLGVAIYGFSRSFKKTSRNVMKRLSVLVYFFSFVIIINSNLLLRKYLNSLTEKEKEMPKYIDIEKWKRYEYLGWF